MLKGLIAVNVSAVTTPAWSHLDIGAAPPGGAYALNSGTFTVSGS